MNPGHAAVHQCRVVEPRLDLHTPQVVRRRRDEVLETFAVVARPEDVGPKLLERFGGVVDTWVASFTPGGQQAKRELLRTLQS